MKKNILSLIFVLLFSCADKNSPQSNDGFTIIGTLQDVPDSSWVFLQSNKQIYDSAMVLNGEFELKGKVQKPIRCVLIIKTTMDYKVFWVEDNKMTFKAKSGKFLNAKITGSKIQIEDDKFLALLHPFINQQDSLRFLLNKEKENDKREVIILKLKELNKKKKKATIYFIQENPNSITSVNTLNGYKTAWGKELTESLYGILSKQLQLSVEGKSIQRYIFLNTNPKVGDQYIDFGQKNVDGDIVNLSDIKAKAVLLDFWAAWCGPCRNENKELVKTYEQYNSLGFEIFGVSGDGDDDSWLEAIKKDGLVWTNVRGELGMESDPFLIYGINGIPDNFLINREGKIIGRNLRGDVLREKLKEVLQ